MKIVDAEGRVVPRGTPGEFCTRGYSVMLGYWDDKERTAQAIDAAGWMHTGDLATMDDEGYCNIVGRIKDMVIRGGENVYPREVEEFLYRHPKIQDVQVFGVPDARYGEELCAWVKLRAGEALTAEEVRDFCRDQIAHYKVPRHIRFVDEFPMTVTGKMQKFIMREQMMRRTGREGSGDRVTFRFPVPSPHICGSTPPAGVSMPHRPLTRRHAGQFIAWAVRLTAISRGRRTPGMIVLLRSSVYAVDGKQTPFDHARRVAVAADGNAASEAACRSAVAPAGYDPLAAAGRGALAGPDAAADRLKATSGGTQMRWARFEQNGTPTYGVVEGDEIIPVRGSPFDIWERTPAGCHCRT